MTDINEEFKSIRDEVIGTFDIEHSLCESCDSNPAFVTLDHKGDSVYELCNNCLLLFINYALTPEYFKNLLRHGHTTKEFYLHSDFYDEDGIALQPKLG